MTATAYHGKGTFENSKSNSAEAPSRIDNDVLMHPEQCELDITFYLWVLHVTVEKRPPVNEYL